MASLNNLFAALASLDPATLLNAAVILLDIPSKILERFSVGLRCIKDIGSPVFCFPVGMNNPEHLDETVLAQVHNSSFRRDINIRNRAVMRVIRVYQPVGFESGTPVPFLRTDQFQVVDTRIPRIEDDAIWLKLSFISSPKHIPEMVIFILPILVRIIDPEIYGNYR